MIKKIILVLMFMIIFTSCSVEQLESKNPVVGTFGSETPVTTEVDIKVLPSVNDCITGANEYIGAPN